MKVLILNLFATALLGTGSALAQDSFESFIQSADNAMTQFSDKGTCKDGNCTTNTLSTTTTSGCTSGMCEDGVQNEPVKKTSNNVVGEALNGLKYVEAKPNTNADYYIYLYSASWCPPCRKLMPSIVQEYAAIKKSNKVELILIGADRNMKEVKAYVNKYNAQFPATWQGVAEVSKLPGNMPPRGIPSAIIVDKKGNIIVSGYGSIVLEWKKYTIDK